jgi:hypothetical protein
MEEDDELKENEEKQAAKSATTEEKENANEEERTVKEKEIIFKRMVLDSVGELLNDLYLERYEKPMRANEFLPKLHVMPKKQYFKSIKLAPNSLLTLKETKLLIKNKLFEVIKLSDESLLEENERAATQASTHLVRAYLQKETEKQRKLNRLKSKWRTQQKKMDLVDKLLDYEMREQEYEWSNYELEEEEAKLLISNSIFDLILKDTVDIIQTCLNKRNDFVARQSQS